MPTIVRNGIKLVFEDRSAGKPAFVFVHGTSCNRSFFARRLNTSPGGIASFP